MNVASDAEPSRFVIDALRSDDSAGIDHPAGFYLRQEFEIVGLIPDANGPGKPDILMAKPLSEGTRQPRA